MVKLARAIQLSSYSLEMVIVVVSSHRRSEILSDKRPVTPSKFFTVYLVSILCCLS